MMCCRGREIAVLRTHVLRLRKSRYCGWRRVILCALAATRWCAEGRHIFCLRRALWSQTFTRRYIDRLWLAGYLWFPSSIYWRRNERRRRSWSFALPRIGAGYGRRLRWKERLRVEGWRSIATGYLEGFGAVGGARGRRRRVERCMRLWSRRTWRMYVRLEGLGRRSGGLDEDLGRRACSGGRPRGREHGRRAGLRIAPWRAQGAWPGRD